MTDAPSEQSQHEFVDTLLEFGNQDEGQKELCFFLVIVSTKVKIYQAGDQNGSPVRAPPWAEAGVKFMVKC